MEPARSGADPVVVNNIIGQIKSRGIFDQFRRDCLADVDTKPAYQNLRQRVEGYVSNYLGQHKWEPGMNKNQLRDSLRRQINQSEMLATGVERIIEQVVEPKIQHIFRPQIENLVKETLNPNYKAEKTDNGNDNEDIQKTDIVAPPPEAPPPDLPSEAVPPPPPPEEEDEEDVGEEDMDISTPSPTSSPDIRLSSPVDVDEQEVESPPPIPGIDIDEADDFIISQMVETEEVPMTIELEPNANMMPTDPRLEATLVADEAESETLVVEEFVGGSEQEVTEDSVLIKQTEQMKVDDKITHEDEPPKTDDEDNLVIAEELSKAGSKRKRANKGADSDGESGLSDITVSSVHTSDLSSFDEEISSSSEESDQSPESSFCVSHHKSPRKSQTEAPVEVSYRTVKLAHRGKGWFLDKYIYVKTRENREKIFLRCQHKYLCKTVAFIDKATDKAYVTQGHHVHPPPDVRKINFGDKKTAAKKSKEDKSKKTSGSRKISPIRLSFPKGSSPRTSSQEDEQSSKKDDISEIESPKEDIQSPSVPTSPLRILSPEAKKAEAERWAAYYEYSMAPEKRPSTKALTLSRYHSDSEDEDSREVRRKKAAIDKEERLRRRQEIREKGSPEAPARPPRVRKEQKGDKKEEEKEEEEKPRRAPKSPIKAIKAQLKEQKILEKKREMRRQRSRNKRYFSDEFSSPIQDTRKESLRVDENTPTTSTSTEVQPVTPIKRPVAGKIKPVILSYGLRFRERRIPQVESHFLLCSCLSGDQQKKMSSRQQKQKSKRQGRKQAKFSFNVKPTEKVDVKKQQQLQTQRARQKKIEEEEKGGSDVSRSSTPVQDEMPVEMTKEEKPGPRRGRGRPRKVEEPAEDHSRSSTPVLDEVSPMVYDVASTSKEMKDEPQKRTRRKPRKYRDSDQEETSRPSTPVQEIVPAIVMEETSYGPRRRGRPQKTPVEEKPVEYSSRSSTPVQDENVLEDMEVDQDVSSALKTVVLQSEQAFTQSEQPVIQSEEPVAPIDIDEPVAPVEEPLVSIEKPVDLTDEPVAQSEELVAQIEEPLVSSEEPLAHREEPLAHREEPVGPREEPVAQSEEPVDQSREPVDQSKEPVDQSKEPVAESEEPVDQSHEAVAPSKELDVQSEKPVPHSDNIVAQREEPVIQSEEHVAGSKEPVAESEDTVSDEPITQSEEHVAQSEEPVQQPVAQSEQTSAVASEPTVTPSDQVQCVEEMDVDTAPAEEVISESKLTQEEDRSLVAKEELESKTDTVESVTETNIVTDNDQAVKETGDANESTTLSDTVAMETDLKVGDSPVSNVKDEDDSKVEEEPTKDDVEESCIDRTVTAEESIEDKNVLKEAQDETLQPSGEGETEEVKCSADEQTEAGDNVISNVDIPDVSANKQSSDDVQQGLNVDSSQEDTAKVDEASLEESKRESVEKAETEIEESSSEKTNVVDIEKTVPSEDSNLVPGADGDNATEQKLNEKIDSLEKDESKSVVVPRPILGHSPTPEDMPKEDEAPEAKEENIPTVSKTESELANKDAKETEVVENEELSVPAVGSSPTSAKADEDEADVDVEEANKTDAEENKDVKKSESEKDDSEGKDDGEGKEESIIVPALGHSPTRTQKDDDKEDGEKMAVDQEPSDLDDNPPTPTQDEPSSMDEISPREADGEEKPAIPIFAVASPSKSPLGGLFSLSRSVSQEGPSSSQDSPAAARSVAGESSGADTNVDSEESVPSVTRETRQRPKRRVSAPQDSDFEYSHRKRLRTETPPPPVLEPELPIERPPEEETRSLSTRASRQRHVSPPQRHSPTPKESGVRTRHQSSQSTESQQSVRTPSPVPAERVTRGRRSSTRQSEEKQSHRYSDMVYYDTGRRSQRQQAAATAAATTPSVGSRRSTRRSVEDKSAEKPTRGKRKR
ncbi:uncharacterized protein [Amphiura filiformis]|uniref:uncharacterized protein n=1 Tax=Amphiura filiformis TaxID=82378 RepID=UPI003B21B336